MPYMFAKQKKFEKENKVLSKKFSKHTKMAKYYNKANINN